MKKLCLTAVILCLAGTAMATATAWQQIDFTCLASGAVSFDASGDNVVVAGSAFYNKITSDKVLGTQLNGGDGIDVEVAGNFAMYGVFSYSDSTSVLPWLMANANTLMAYEFRAWGVKMDFNGDNISDLTENFTLNATGMPGVDYLKATFGQMSQWGYTELAPGVFVDIAVVNSSCAALSVVIDGFTHAGWTDFNANLLMSLPLQGPSSNTPGSGVRVMAIPEPATMSILALGALGLIRRK
jgi:hypothetical protein